MLRDNRILFKHSTISDLSAPLSDIYAGTSTLAIEVGDFLYIGSYVPFNHRFFDVSTVNDQASVVSVDYWTGEEWAAAIDVIDETSVGGIPFARDGIISWGLNPRTINWGFDDTDLMIGSGIETQNIFGLYWARMKWSANLKATTAMGYIGHKFSSDPGLESQYPDLANSALKAAWKTGKVDWDEQHLLAAEYIVQDLRGKRRKIVSASQIMSWQLFDKAAIHRTAMIIYAGLGKDYIEVLAECVKSYNSAMNLGNFEIDESRNGILESAEKESSVISLRR